MKTLRDVHDIEREMKTMLTEQSELDEQFVRNALSEYGTVLNKQLSTPDPSDIFDSISPRDSMVLFAVTPADSTENVSESEEDDKISYYHSFKAHIIIYGDDCENLATKLVARIRTNEVRDRLYDAGLYLEEVSDTTSVNEYKADVMWLRTDFDINIACQLSIEPIMSYNSFKELTTITISNT